ncbi:MAG: amidohydrolase family protein [Benniella sp.]|nr:MAG: amidohydrolase family protein [Benniella sp.]
MCQGSTPEYFEFKESPPELPPGWLCSRFLDTPPESDAGTGPKEYIVSKTAPCPIIDAHVHVFPQKLMDAVWTFFDNFYWPVRYKETYLANRADFLIEQGVHHVVLLVYAHRAGIARDLNKFLAQTVNSMNERYSQTSDNGAAPRRRVATGLGTVMPGEPGATEILAEAFSKLGLSGIKMHSHVQCVPANHPTMDEVYETCVRFNKPVLIHAGKEPNSAAYKVDAGKICDASIVEDVLKRYPTLRICVPHLGMNQYQEFFDLLDRYPNLYLDTTMTLAAFFKSFGDDEPLVEMMRSMLLKYSDRVLYGTDWPNIPYDWCRELANLVSLVDGDGEATNVTPLAAKDEKGKQRTIQGDTALERILWRNASRFYGISEADLGLSALASL